MADINDTTSQGTESDIEQLSEILQIRRDKLAALCAAGQNPYEKVKFDVDTYTTDIHTKFDEYEGRDVRIAGRLMSRRDMGKANFIDISDAKGRIQCYIKIDDVGEEIFDQYRKWDIGDIVGLSGKVFKTRRGEVSIHIYSIELLSKSLLPLPEKFHGLRDTDLRYRQRYVDLIVNPEVKEVFVKRSKIITEIRSYLENDGFLEVETPILHSQAGGANAKPFITHHNTLDIDMHLRIALELHLKRLIVGGFDKVYEIGRVFRNEGMSTRHNPEFTLLELYQAYTDYNGMMDITENMLRHVAEKVLGKTTVTYSEYEINLGDAFERISMSDAVLKYAGVDFSKIKTLDEARDIAKERGVAFENRHKTGDILNLFFEKFAEEKLIQPTFVMNHPVDISPLAKRMPENPDYTERFELFILGREYANAFSELNDPIDQRGRFEAQAALKAAGDDEANDVDEDFICALEYGMPPCGGLGIGIDRVVMLLTNSASIRDVLLFPTMKPINE